MATRGTAQRGKSTSDDAALDRLSGSLEAAQAALRDLRRELSKGGREVLKDLDALLRDARKNLRGTRRTLVKDLEEVHKAAAGKRAPARKRPPARAKTAAKRTGATSARKTTGRTTRAAGRK
jgi:hypothetical protein